MIPYIRRPKAAELIFDNKVKWVVVSHHLYEDRDLCHNFAQAIRFWLWHMGVNPRIAFGLSKKKRKNF